MALKLCTDTTFHGIDCLEHCDEYGFEGCYRDDLNHPDPRPAHRIWIRKLHAEKLFKIFALSEQTKNTQLPEEQPDKGKDARQTVKPIQENGLDLSERDGGVVDHNLEHPVENNQDVLSEKAEVERCK